MRRTRRPTCENAVWLEMVDALGERLSIEYER
jgi:hypothetical protein